MSGSAVEAQFMSKQKALEEVNEELVSIQSSVRISSHSCSSYLLKQCWIIVYGLTLSGTHGIYSVHGGRSTEHSIDKGATAAAIHIRPKAQSARGQADRTGNAASAVGEARSGKEVKNVAVSGVGLLLGIVEREYWTDILGINLGAINVRGTRRARPFRMDQTQRGAQGGSFVLHRRHENNVFNLGHGLCWCSIQNSSAGLTVLQVTKCRIVRDCHLNVKVRIVACATRVCC